MSREYERVSIYVIGKILSKERLSPRLDQSKLAKRLWNSAQNEINDLLIKCIICKSKSSWSCSAYIYIYIEREGKKTSLTTLIFHHFF